MFSFIYFTLASTSETIPALLIPTGNKSLTLYNEDGALVDNAEFKLTMNVKKKPKIKDDDNNNFWLFVMILPVETYEEDPSLLTNAIIKSNVEDLEKFTLFLSSKIKKISINEKNESVEKFILTPSYVQPSMTDKSLVGAEATLKVNAEKEISEVNIYLNNLSALEIQKGDAEERSYTLVIMTFHETNPKKMTGSYNRSRKILIESLEKKINTSADEDITITTPLDMSVPEAKKDNPQENTGKVTNPLQNTHVTETPQQAQAAKPLEKIVTPQQAQTPESHGGKIVTPQQTPTTTLPENIEPLQKTQTTESHENVVTPQQTQTTESHEKIVTPQQTQTTKPLEKIVTPQKTQTTESHEDVVTPQKTESHEDVVTPQQTQTTDQSSYFQKVLL